jgi:hypothetical protein
VRGWRAGRGCCISAGVQVSGPMGLVV